MIGLPGLTRPERSGRSGKMVSGKRRIRAGTAVVRCLPVLRGIAIVRPQSARRACNKVCEPAHE
jgi:hypothetical protein